jgi:DNA-directed RNA polymerase III subunit RPC11
LLKQKEVEDIVGGAAQWESAQKTEVKCPNNECDSMEAFFQQLQTRSADEPMTNFYKVGG